MIDKARTAAYVGAYFVRATELLPGATIDLSRAASGLTRIQITVYGPDESGERRFSVGRMVDAPLFQAATFDASHAGEQTGEADARALAISLHEAGRRAERARMMPSSPYPTGPMNPREPAPK